MSGCSNSGAEESCTARQTTSPVIARYTPIATTQNSTARKTIFRSAVTIANPDVATLASSQPPCARSRRPAPRSRHMRRATTGASESQPCNAIPASTHSTIRCSASRAPTTAQAAM